MNRRSFLIQTGLFSIGIALGLPNQSQASSMAKETRAILGTFVNITVFDPATSKAENAIGTAFERCAELDKELSRFDPSSPVFALNQGQSLSDAPEDLIKVLQSAMSTNHATNGSFDVTVQPLVDYLSAHKNPHGKMDLNMKEFEELSKLIDMSALNVKGNKISLDKQGMGITLDGIAKGYIVDKMSEILKSQNVCGFVVDAGGDVRVGGSSEGGRPWRVAIQDPWNRNGYITTLNMREGAVATSGGYEQQYDSKGEFSHIVNPRSGISPKTIKSVSVCTDTAMQADALATAFYVMNPVDVIEMADSIDRCACLLVLKNGRRVKSSKWGKLG